MLDLGLSERDVFEGDPRETGFGWMLISFEGELVVVAWDTKELRRARRELKEGGVDPDRDFVGYIMDEVQMLRSLDVSIESMKMIHEAKRRWRGKIVRGRCDPDGLLRSASDDKASKKNAELTRRNEEARKSIEVKRGLKGKRPSNHKVCGVCKLYETRTFRCRVHPKLTRFCKHLCGIRKVEETGEETAVCASCQIKTGMLERRTCPGCFGSYRVSDGPSCLECQQYEAVRKNS